jgi:hypothetical protein
VKALKSSFSLSWHQTPPPNTESSEQEAQRLSTLFSMHATNNSSATSPAKADQQTTPRTHRLIKAKPSRESSQKTATFENKRKQRRQKQSFNPSASE